VAKIKNMCGRYRPGDDGASVIILYYAAVTISHIQRLLNIGAFVVVNDLFTTIIGVGGSCYRI
jgi:hypothetical protein